MRLLYRAHKALATTRRSAATCALAREACKCPWPCDYGKKCARFTKQHYDYTLEFGMAMP